MGNRRRGRQRAVQVLYEWELTGRSIDVVLEMSGAPPAINDALKLLRPGGTMCVLGIVYLVVLYKVLPERSPYAEAARMQEEEAGETE